MDWENIETCIHSEKENVLRAGAPSEQLFPIIFQKKSWRRALNPRFWILRVLAEIPSRTRWWQEMPRPVCSESQFSILCSRQRRHSHPAEGLMGLVVISCCFISLLTSVTTNQNNSPPSSVRALSDLNEVPGENKYQVLLCWGDPCALAGGRWVNSAFLREGTQKITSKSLIIPDRQSNSFPSAKDIQQRRSEKEIHFCSCQGNFSELFFSEK